MDDPPILICYDGSPEVPRAITVAADLIPFVPPPLARRPRLPLHERRLSRA